MWKVVVRAVLTWTTVVIGLAGCPSDDQSGAEGAGDGGFDAPGPDGDEPDASGQMGPVRDGGDAAQREAGVSDGANGAMDVDSGSPDARPPLGTLCMTSPLGTTCMTEEVIAQTGARVRAFRSVSSGVATFAASVEIPAPGGGASRTTSFQLKGSVPEGASLPRRASLWEAFLLILPTAKCERMPGHGCLSVSDSVTSPLTLSVCEAKSGSAQADADGMIAVHAITPDEVWATFTGTLAIDFCFPLKEYFPSCAFRPNALLVEQVCDANGKCHQEDRQARFCVDENVPLEVTLRLPF